MVLETPHSSNSDGLLNLVEKDRNIGQNRLMDKRQVISNCANTGTN